MANLLQESHNPFKRYCELQQFESLNPQQDYEEDDPYFGTQILMLPEDKQRSKTADGTRLLKLKNIGDDKWSKPKLGERNVYSRENIQNMNKKFRQIRFSQYGLNSNGLNSNDMRYSDRPSNQNQFRVTGSSRNFRKNKAAFQSATQLKASNIQERRKNCSNLVPNSSVKIFKRHLYHESSSQFESRPTVEPQSFRTTIRHKCVDENPKILANIIRRKAERLSRQQMQHYIFGLMKKSKK